jgi:hypothetical protein
MYRCVEETADDPRDLLSNYFAPLRVTGPRFELLSQNLFPLDHVYAHHKISLV